MSAVAIATSAGPKAVPRNNAVKKPSVLVLSSSLLVDRMLIYTDFLDVLQEAANPTVWATSAQNPDYQTLWRSMDVSIEDFPRVDGFREFPHNYLRRLNEYVWDFRKRPPSRISMARHVRDKQQPFSIRALKLPARILAGIKVERAVEQRLEQMLAAYQRSPESYSALQRSKPDVVITTGPFQFEQPAIIANARRLGIRTLALIPSWDNISTKGRMPLSCDGYITWSEQGKAELHDYYPSTRNKPVYVVGAPQFDVFFRSRFNQTRETFCAGQSLRPDRPIIVYAVGSPNFLRGEHHGALQLAERIERGDLGDVQMIVRPHPIHDNAEMVDLFRRFAPRVVVQKTAKAGTALTARSQDEKQVIEWVNTFRHADVVVNLSSTVSIDAAICDRPVVNLDYDPTPGSPDHDLIKDINHRWTHFKPVAESGGLRLVNNQDELVGAVKSYLAHPEKDRSARRRMVDYVCGYADGRCGQRMAEAAVDFAMRTRRNAKSNGQ
jgi:hypothetical protein